jgi:hypothetical protein
MAATNNLTVYKGETVTQPFAHVVEDTTTPVNITGWTIAFTLRYRATDVAALLTVSGQIVSGPAGTYTVSLTHAQTVGLAAGVYAYDIQRTDVGSEAVMSIGRFTVTQEVLYP